MAIDSITFQGIMPLHPISRAKIKGFIRTGSIFEWALFSFFVVFSIYELVYL